MCIRQRAASSRVYMVEFEKWWSGGLRAILQRNILHYDLNFLIWMKQQKKYVSRSHTHTQFQGGLYINVEVNQSPIRGFQSGEERGRRAKKKRKRTMRFSFGWHTNPLSFEPPLLRTYDCEEWMQQRELSDQKIAFRKNNCGWWMQFLHIWRSTSEVVVDFISFSCLLVHCEVSNLFSVIDVNK